MTLCLPISSTTNEFDYISTTYFTNQPTTFSGTTINAEIPNTTVMETSTHNPEIVAIEQGTDLLNRIDLNEEPIEPHSTEPNFLNVYIETTLTNEDEREEVIQEIASTVLPTETLENFNIIPTSSTDNEREITTNPYIEVQTTPARKFTRVSKTTRTPYRKRVEIITKKTPRYLTLDEMRARHGANSKFKFTKNLFYVLCPVVVVAIVMGIFYVKRINEI